MKKGFTLIELLAVIIILGILMLVAIPSVTSYVNNSRKESYVSTVHELIKAASIKVNNGEVEVYDKNTTYYLPVSALELENGVARSPYGEFDEAYIVVTTDGENYDYFFVGKDETDMGVETPKKEDKLNNNSIKSGINSINTSIGIDNKKNIIVLDSDLKTIVSQTEASNNVDSETGDNFKLVCKRAKVLLNEYCDTNTASVISFGFNHGDSPLIGNLGTSGTYSVGDAFDCDFDGDGIYYQQNFNDKERFYYIGQNGNNLLFVLYTTTRQGGTIYNWSRIWYDDSNENWHGPVKLMPHLASTETWKTLELTTTYKQIYNEKHGTTTKDHDLPIIDYSGKAGRILTIEDIRNAGCLKNDETLEIDYNKCLFLMAHTEFFNNNSISYWLENAYSEDNRSAMFVNGITAKIEPDNTRSTKGVRSVIEVPMNKVEQ